MKENIYNKPAPLNDVDPDDARPTWLCINGLHYRQVAHETYEKVIRKKPIPKTESK